MIRKTRSDKGKKRIGQRIRSAALNTAKYGAGLYVGSKIYGAGAKLGEKITTKLAEKIAPDAKEGGRIDQAKNLGKIAGTMLIADQTSKSVGRLANLAKRKREEREEARKKNGR